MIKNTLGCLIFWGNLDGLALSSFGGLTNMKLSTVLKSIMSWEEKEEEVGKLGQGVVFQALKLKDFIFLKEITYLKNMVAIETHQNDF